MKLAKLAVGMALISGVCFSQNFAVFDIENGINAIAFDNDTVWLGTGDGVVKLDREGNVLAEYKPSDGLASYTVYSVAIDLDGNKWFGTGDGVSKFDGETWVTYKTEDGLGSNVVSSVSIGPDNIKWFGTWGGVTLFDGDTMITYTTSQRLPNNIIYDIEIDSNGIKWFATGWGLTAYGEEQLSNIDGRDGLEDNVIKTLDIDKDGYVWIGTMNGIAYIHQDNMFGTPTTFNTGDGLVDSRINSLDADEFGNIWIATWAGVSKFDPQTGEWTTYTADDGLPANYTKVVKVDQDGNVWFGLDNGVAMLSHSLRAENDFTSLLYSSGIDFSLCPDPYRKLLVISYDLSESQNIEISLYDLKGKLVNNVYSGFADTGKSSKIIQTENIFSGMYLCRIKTERHGFVVKKIKILN